MILSCKSLLSLIRVRRNYIGIDESSNKHVFTELTNYYVCLEKYFTAFSYNDWYIWRLQIEKVQFLLKIFFAKTYMLRKRLFCPRNIRQVEKLRIGVVFQVLCLCSFKSFLEFRGFAFIYTYIHQEPMAGILTR